MAAMKTVIKGTDKGGGLYEGKCDLGSGGMWQVTITAQQNGQTIATKKLTAKATAACKGDVLTVDMKSLNVGLVIAAAVGQSGSNRGERISRDKDQTMAGLSDPI